MSEHTPDHVVNSTCACTVDFNEKVATIRYCPMHASAPDLLGKIERIAHIVDLHVAGQITQREFSLQVRAALDLVNKGRGT